MAPRSILSYLLLCCCDKNIINKSSLQKEEFILACRFRGIKVHHGGGGGVWQEQEAESSQLQTPARKEQREQTGVTHFFLNPAKWHRQQGPSSQTSQPMKDTSDPNYNHPQNHKRLFRKIIIIAYTFVVITEEYRGFQWQEYRLQTMQYCYLNLARDKSVLGSFMSTDTS